MGDIENQLLSTWWGVGLLGALGSAIFWAIANFAGRTNKGVKWLWKFYKEGIQSHVEGLCLNEKKFELYKYIANRKFWMASVILSTIFLLALVVVLLDRLHISLSIIIFLNLVQWLLVTIDLRIIKKVYKILIQHEGYDEEGDENP